MDKKKRLLLLHDNGQLLSYQQKILSLLFGTPSGPPIANPYVGDIGQVSVTQTDGQFTVSGGVLNFPAQTTSLVGDQGFYGAAMTRLAGRALRTKVRFSASANQFTTFGWNRNAINNPNTCDEELFTAASANFAAGFNNSSVPGSLAIPVSTATNYDIVIMLRSAGALYFAKGGVLTDWSLVWVTDDRNTATLYPFFDNYAGVGTLDFFDVVDFAAPFTTDYGIYTLNQASPVSGTSYLGNADGIIGLTVTAPASLVGQNAELRYRVQDANNYWTAYFDAAGSFRLDSVAAGVATNRIAVVGVISGSQTQTIRVICNGSSHDCYTKLGTTWAKRGSTVTVSHLNTLTTIQPVVTAGYSMTNLRSVARTSSAYSVLGAP